MFDMALAQYLLAQRVAEYRALPYSELAEKILRGDVDTCETDMSGVIYQFEFQFFWNDEPYNDIRVVAFAFTDPTGTRVRDDFVLSPSGRIVGG